MSKTALSATTTALSLWSVVMLIPLLLWFISSKDFRLFLYLFYPIVIAFMSRQGLFWVKLDVIAISSMVTFLIGYLISLNKKAGEAMEKPSEHKGMASLIFTTLSLIFLGIIFGASQVTYLYNPSNFT